MLIAKHTGDALRRQLEGIRRPSFRRDGVAYNISPEVRFWSYVDIMPSGCWEWVGSRLSKRYRYGRMHVGKSLVLAHRFSWTISRGAIPDGLDVLHKCNNAPCVNPDHLYLGTNFENQRDRVLAESPFRCGSSVKTHCPRGHPYSGDNLKITANGNRKCKICIHAYSLGRSEKRRAKCQA